MVTMKMRKRASITRDISAPESPPLFDAKTGPGSSSTRWFRAGIAAAAPAAAGKAAVLLELPARRAAALMVATARR